MSTRKHELSINGDSPGWASPIVRESLGNKAYKSLRDALMAGRLAPGERLRLRPISKRFGISATPMREALLRLVSLDALCLDARGTAMVPELTVPQLIEIRNIRMDLEGRAGAAAATEATVDEIDTLEQLHSRLAAALEAQDFPTAIPLNTQFHLSLCRAGRMPILLDIVETLWVRCGPLLSHLYGCGAPVDAPHPHATVLEGLRARDSDAVRDAIRHDIETGAKGLLRRARRSGGV